MAIQHIPFTRGGKDYMEHIGTDVDGQSVHYIDEVEPDALTGQPVRWKPEFTGITRQGLGGVSHIETVWSRNLVGASGELIPQTQTERQPMSSNQTDILFFIAGLGLPIMRSETNGLVRSRWGFDDMPVHDSLTGQVKTYTPEQEAAPPRFKYDSPTENPA